MEQNQAQKETQQKKKFYKIENDKLFLVPYLKEFVPIYHQWMQDEEILFLTGSEPLTLEEEYENHKSWLFDPSKYTFIVFQKNEQIEKQDPEFPDYASKGKQAGDINLFFHDYLEENEAEIDVMIGEKSCRKQGLAENSVNIMMDFGRAFYKKNKFIAKIKDSNSGSISLFKKLGYKQFAEVKAFEEVHFEFTFEKEFTQEEFKQKYGIQEVEVNE